jgi:hypothetical protein
MNFIHLTKTRDDLIHLGNTLGRIFKDSDRTAPWILTFGASTSSGKSLVGSAIDQAFDPLDYPDGILEDHYADLLMYMKPAGPVKYVNLAQDRYETQAVFDRWLSAMERNHPGARVLICANTQRGHVSQSFNYSASGLQSDRLDMNIDFHVWGRDFERKLVITAENQELCDALQRSALTLGPA